MEIMHENHVWKSCMEIMYRNDVWKWCMEIMYGNMLGISCTQLQCENTVWKSCVEIVYGHLVWKSCVEILHGNYVWKSFRETLYGNSAWKSCMEICMEAGGPSWRPKLEAKAGENDLMREWLNERMREWERFGILGELREISSGWGNRLEATGGTARSWLQPPALKKLSENPLGKPS